MAIWLLKTEPSDYSLADLERDGQTMWDGVTNNQALQNLRLTLTGDTALIYHTGDEKCVVGIAEIARGFYVNPERDDPKLAVCDVEAVERLKNPLTLAQIKATPELAGCDLVRLGRLSVVTISEEQWQIMQTLMEG